MNKFMLFLILIILILLAVALSCDIGFAAQDSDTQTSIVTLTIPPTCRLVITNPNCSKTLTQDGTSEASFDAGRVDFDSGCPALQVFANKSWKLMARSSGFTGPYAKDIGDLQLKNAGAEHVTMGDFTSLSAVDQEVASYSAGVRNENHPCQYRILLDWAKDIPGTYEVTVTYTLSTDAS